MRIYQRNNNTLWNYTQRYGFYIFETTEKINTWVKRNKEYITFVKDA